MERAAQHSEAHPAPPVAQDPDLPTVSNTALMLFAGGALFVTAVALLILLD